MSTGLYSKVAAKATATLKMDTHYFMRGAFWLSLSNAVAILSGLLLSIGLANLLPKEAFGEYKYVLALGAIFGSFALTGVDTSVIRSVATGRDSAIYQAVASYFKWSIPSILISIAASFYYFLQGNLTLAGGLFLVGLFWHIITGFNLSGRYLEGKKAFKTLAILSVPQNVVPAATILFTITLTDKAIFVLISYFMSMAAVAAMSYFFTIAYFKPPPNRADPSAIPYAKHLSVINCLSAVAGQIDKVLIFQFLGAAPLAIYAFAIAPITQLLTGNKIIGKLLLPRLAGYDIKTIRGSAMRKILISGVFSLALFVGYILLAPYIFELLFPQYIDAVRYSQLYATMFLLSPFILFGTTFSAHAKKKELYTRQIVASTLRIVLFLVLLPTLGLTGAILTLVLSKLADTIVSGVLFYRMQ